MKYQYKCSKGHITEHDYKMGHNPEWVACPNEKCMELNGHAVRYLGEMPPVQFNGTGFASTEIPRRSGLEDHWS